MGAPKINNDIYDELGPRWYEAKDDPIALLRAESRVRTNWILNRLCEPENCHVLDIACGAGFISNALARHGYDVTGVDLSAKSLDVARAHDGTRSVQYVEGDAYHLPFKDEHFDAVLVMDFLEHVERPWAVVEEAARVLKPGGLFFFHTFNRTKLSNLIIIKGLEKFIRNTPEHLHVHQLFVTPEEMRRYCESSGLIIRQIEGIRPTLLTKAFWRTVSSGVVDEGFRFQPTRFTGLSYLGVAQKGLSA